MKDFDVCIIGSGAGGGPVAHTLAVAGHAVVVLEKGPWFKQDDFYKDEIACCRRSTYTPNLRDERHVIEDSDGDGGWNARSSYDSGRDFWNGNCVGGSSNVMSGYFHRLKPVDFRLHSEFGPIKGANVVDWPISYADLEPYYARVEQVIGVSGRVVKHPFQEPRSSADFPQPPTAEHSISGKIDRACDALGYHPIPVPRAILSRPMNDRQSCAYSGYCGSYGCSTGAKGSSRAALLDQAVASGHCQIRPHAKVERLLSDQSGRVSGAVYFDQDGLRKTVTAKIFVVACQAIETARLLLLSTGPRHPNGLANAHGQVGKNLLFSAGGSGGGDFHYADLEHSEAEQMQQLGPFVNRALQDWYVIDDRDFGARAKGGTVDFLFRHPNPIGKALSRKRQGGDLIWGSRLQQRIKRYFNEARHFRFEVFNDWLPTDDCFVALDGKVTDKWGTPVARVRVGYHSHDLKIGRYIADKATTVLDQMGASDVFSGVSGSPPVNLVAGGCRFGKDPRKSVLDADCRAHDSDNLYLSDGSFMPTGGSVPYTWTIYANAFRVADKIKLQLGGSRA